MWQASTSLILNTALLKAVRAVSVVSDSFTSVKAMWSRPSFAGSSTARKPRI